MCTESITLILLLWHSCLTLVSTDLCSCFCSSAKGSLPKLSLRAELQRKRTGSSYCVKYSVSSYPMEKEQICASESNAPNIIDFSGRCAPKETEYASTYAEQGRKLRTPSPADQLCKHFPRFVRAGNSLANIRQQIATQDRNCSVEALGDHHFLDSLLMKESSVIHCAGFIRLYSAFSNTNAGNYYAKGGARIPAIRCHESARMGSNLRLRGGGHNVYRNRDDRQARSVHVWKDTEDISWPHTLESMVRQDRVFDV
jgi:hypothetical protein